MYYRVLVASQRFHGSESLTYSSDSKLVVGQVVQVPLQKQLVTGIVEGEAEKPRFTTKPIANQWDYKIPGQSLQLLTWLTGYYPAPLGMLVELFTPPAMPKTLEPHAYSTSPLQELELPDLTGEQTKVISDIRQSTQKSFLLYGQTGTGKTRVYMELIQEALTNGTSAILLTPEIGLTQPLIEACQQLFGDRVVVTHSGMTPAQRRQSWLRAASSIDPVVVVGPRSALFLPLKKIGLVVIDEAHDSAYKQEQAPYYTTTRVAAQLASLHKAKLILGTATPPIADYFVFQQKKLPVLTMTKPAIASDHDYQTIVIDQTDKTQFTRSPYLATPLLKEIDQALGKNEQTMLFLNRRGSARLVACNNCGWQAVCPHCDTTLTFHADKHIMRCHSCDHSATPPTACPDCGQSDLLYKSIGTKALETEVRRLYPQATVARFDRDTEKAERLPVRYKDLRDGKVQIIIGTQAIAKGFDLPNLSVVGIINADSGLQIPDYTANERTYQLLSQVSGRIGRGHRAGKLFVQSYQPDNNVLKQALRKDYSGFMLHELEQRELFRFPPYYYLAKLTCLRPSSSAAQAACTKLVDDLKSHKGIQIEGPAPRFIEKVANKYGWHIILKAKDRRVLTAIASSLPSNVICDLDPSDLL